MIKDGKNEKFRVRDEEIIKRVNDIWNEIIKKKKK